MLAMVGTIVITIKKASSNLTVQDFSAIETMQTSLLLTIRPQYGTGKNISRFSTSSCLSVRRVPRRLTEAEAQDLRDETRYLVNQAQLYEHTANYEGENGNLTECTRLGEECENREERATKLMRVVAKHENGEAVKKPRQSGFGDYFAEEGANFERTEAI